VGSTMGVYNFLDKFFFVFHSLLILFNLSGWMWKKTRRLNLVLLLLTGFSWTILGIWYGFGFCPSTEWHWQVRMKLGLPDMPPHCVGGRSRRIRAIVKAFLPEPTG